MEVNAVTADVQSAENQAKTAETAAQGAVEGAVAAAEAQLKAVVSDVEKVAEQVEAKEVAWRVDITDAEKLALRNLENEYLKAQMEIQRLSAIVQNAQKQFPVLVESFVKKYAINPAVHVFDAVELAFKRK